MPILFVDLDDTVVDRRATFERWANAFAAERGLGEEAVAHLIAEDGDGMRNRAEFADAVTARFGLGDALTDVVFMDAFAASFECSDDVRGALAEARFHGRQIAIITNGGRWQQVKIESAGLLDLVDTVCVSSIEGVAKPDPGMLHIAADRLGSSLEGAWMIGDSDADIGAACAAGVRSVWLRHGRAWSHPEFRPTAETDSFADAVGVVLR